MLCVFVLVLFVFSWGAAKDTGFADTSGVTGVAHMRWLPDCLLSSSAILGSVAPSGRMRDHFFIFLSQGDGSISWEFLGTQRDPVFLAAPQIGTQKQNVPKRNVLKKCVKFWCRANIGILLSAVCAA